MICPHCKNWSSEKPDLDITGKCPKCKRVYDLPNGNIIWVDDIKKNLELVTGSTSVIMGTAKEK